MTELYEALRAIDVPEEKALRCAQAINPDRLATKADLTDAERALKADLANTERTLRAEIKAVETNLRGEIKAVETKLDNKIDRVATSVEKLGRQMSGMYAWQAVIAAGVAIELLKNFFVH